MFAGVWASGLSISAALGVRDNNEASWTQVLEVVEFMADATTVPIMLDGDTGYGNFEDLGMLFEHLFHLAGIDIKAAANDHILGPVGQAHEPVAATLGLPRPSGVLVNEVYPRGPAAKDEGAT